MKHQSINQHLNHKITMIQEINEMLKIDFNFLGIHDHSHFLY